MPNERDIEGFDPLTNPLTEAKVKEVRDLAMETVKNGSRFIVFTVSPEGKPRTTIHNFPGPLFKRALNDIVESYIKIMKQAETDTRLDLMMKNESVEFKL